MSYDPNPCVQCGSQVHGEGNLCRFCAVEEATAQILANFVFNHGQHEEAFDRWWKQVQAYAEQRGCAWVLATKEDHRDGFNKGRKPEFEVEEQLNAAFYSR